MQYSLERSQNIVLTLKKKRFHVFFLSPTQDGSFWGCLRIGRRVGKKPPLLNLKSFTHIPE